jgi:hypothetical protein
MDETVNSTDHPHPHGNHSQWQLLGELTLSNEDSSVGQIPAWLLQLLEPLPLRPRLVNRIAASARDAAARVLQPELKLEHIHLKIYGPRRSVSTGQTWGFFRVEKIENSSEVGASASHAVEFYLYTEGPESTRRP